LLSPARFLSDRRTHDRGGANNRLRHHSAAILRPNRSGLMVRGRGFLLLMLYVGFACATLTY
jgi:hypothetical protein